MTYSNLPSAPPPAPGEAYGAPRGPRPTTVVNAVRLMYVQVAVSVLSTIPAFATKDDLKKQILKDNPNASDSTVNAALAVGAVVGIVFVVLYALLAWQVGKGKNWARIVTWVLGGLGIIFGLVGLGRPEPTLTKVLGVIGLVIAAAVVVLLAMRPSNEFFRASARYH